MRSLSRYLALPALLFVVVACDKKPTEPDQPEPSAALAAAQDELAGIVDVLPAVSDTDPAAAPTPLLARLTRIALERLTAAGAEELKARAVAALRERHQALQRAIESGDREAILRAKRGLDETAARVVLTVLSPRIVPAVIQHVGRQVRALNARVDAAAENGADVTGPRRVLAAVTARLMEARGAFERGNHANALIMATTAGDLLFTAFHR